jgi:(2Fe-2S) ferredoxin
VRWAWLFGLVLACCCCRAAPRLRGAAAGGAGAAPELLNQAPASAYFAHTLQAWEQGRFIRFHGLAQWLGWLWPYAVLVYVLLRVSRRRPRPTIRGDERASPDYRSTTSTTSSSASTSAERRGLLRDHNAQAGFDRCKAQVKAQGLAGPGKVRVNKAGCLDRCQGGPIAVVYPEASGTPTWTRGHRRDRRIAPEERQGGRALC